MHVLKIMFPRAEVPFYFKTGEGAAAAYEALTATWTSADLPPFYELRDSFNRRGSVNLGDVIGITLMDAEEDLKAQVDLALLQQQATTAAQRRAAGAPSLTLPRMQ